MGRCSSARMTSISFGVPTSPAVRAGLLRLRSQPVQPENKASVIIWRHPFILRGALKYKFCAVIFAGRIRSKLRKMLRKLRHAGNMSILGREQQSPSEVIDRVGQKERRGLCIAASVPAFLDAPLRLTSGSRAYREPSGCSRRAISSPARRACLFCAMRCSCRS
jgi:hypothetical protein